MNKLSVIAVDDEAPALRRLCKMVEENPELQLISSARNSVEAIEQISLHLPDLLLLDIQLKDATAFEVLEEVKDNFTGKIIFITAYDQYAVKAFEFEALDYLLKPYTKARFETAISKVVKKEMAIDIDKVLNLLSSNSKEGQKSLMIPEGVKNYFLNKDEVRYIYSETYYANFVLSDEKRLIRISLKKLDEILPDDFVRINKSTIINQKHIKELVNNKSSVKVIMPDGNEFQVSDSYIRDFRKLLKTITNR